MNPSKIDTLCEKHAKECNQDNPVAQNNASVCSCSKCNSYECFSLRKKRNCLCNQASKPQPFSESKKDIDKTCQSKFSLINNKLPEAESVLKERVKKEITYEYNNTNNMATVKKYSKYSYNCVPGFGNQENTYDDKINISTEKLAHSHSATTYSRQNFDTNTAKLSAQIMDVPYKDFKESISDNKSVISTIKSTKLSRHDIIRRIREAYKACSCKICECLIGKATNRSEFCKCKPCECNECTDLIKRIDNKWKNNQMPIGFSCLRCDRVKECKAVKKKEPPAYCNCDPCDCLNCTDNLNEPCNCQPCECIECRSYSVTKPRKNNTLMVASMREDVPRAYCQCSPCGCAECIQNFSIATSLRREMGTGTNRTVNCSCETCVNQSCEAHDSNSCTCDVQKRLMRKPVEKDTRDYDIHRASIINNVTEGKNKNKNDKVAMFAALENSFPKFEMKNNSCSCGDCECIVCCGKKNTTFIQDKPSKCHNSRACKCAACECVICDSSIKGIDFLDREIKCECNICDCIKCNDLLKPGNYDRHTKSIDFKSMNHSNACKCGPCECTDCPKMMYKCTGDKCCCTSCKCQMCTDQTKCINETVYHNRSNYFSLPSTYGNINGEYFLNKNYGKTCLPLNSLQSDREPTIQTKSRQNITIYNESISFKGLKDNSLRKSTQVLIANNSGIKEQKKHQTTSAGEPYAQCKEKKVMQSYHKAPEYESSRSFMSENSSMGLSYRISNIQQSGNLSSVMEQTYTSESVFQIETPCDRSAQYSVLIKPPVKTCSNDYTNLEFEKKYTNSYENTCNRIESLNASTKTYPNIDYPNFDVNQHGKGTDHEGIGANIKKNEFPGVDDWSCSMRPISKTFSDLNKNNEFTVKDHDITNVKDLSNNLVASLKSANERLSILMKPRLSCYHPKLGQTKADISLPRKTNIKKETISTRDYEFNAALQNSCPKYPKNLSDIDINYDKIISTLQQAKAFSVELTKVLNVYERTNRKLESKFLEETLTNNYRYSLLDMNHCSKTNNIEMNKMIYSNIKSENLVEGLGQEPYSLLNERVNEYGSHNLNITKTKQEISDTDDYQIAKMDNSKNNLPDNESAKVTHDVDDDINNKNIITRHTTPELNHDGNIFIDALISSKDKQVEELLNEHKEPLTNACTHKNEQKHKCRSSKTQKNILGGNNRLRVPKSVKRLKLKDALINIASNSTNNGIRQDSLVPQSIQCEKVIIADETTQHEPYFVEAKRETTSTATDAMGRHQTSRFVESVQDVNGAENPSWSILKKNCLMNSPNMQNRGILFMPPLLLDVKDTLRAISMQYGEPEKSEDSNDVTVTGHANRALLQLQTEVHKLWHSSMSQSSESKPGSSIGKSTLEVDLKDFISASSQTCHLTNSVEKAVDCKENTLSVALIRRQVRELLDKLASVKNPVVKKSLQVNDIVSSGGSTVRTESINTKSSCDILKVKFLGLRRVSDHTVLVKWKPPQDVSSVQGYELLVDGRAVQKILSPSRCMAVVTCLPHIEKVLITIRTLVSTAIQRSHHPSATAVYRTRAK